MKSMLFLFVGIVFCSTLFVFTDVAKQDRIATYTNSKAGRAIPDTSIRVKVQLEKTITKDMLVLFIVDTATTTESIKDVFGKDYGELTQYIQLNKLQPQKFMAWYYSSQPPWPIDVAVETNKIPSQLTGRIQTRTLEGGEVLIAHMWGPYDQAGRAYTEIENWLKENNRKAKANRFEVYLNDPSMVTDPSEIRTDIYQPLE